jgi:gamma-glutamylcysteine synthetase
MAPTSTTPEQDLQQHTYVSHVIPWYVRLMWLVFWIFAAAYVIRNFLPAIQTELLTPP